MKTASEQTANTAAMRLTKNSKLFITNGAALFIGTVNDTEFHSHHMLQITCAHGSEFLIEIADKGISARSIVLDANCRHRLTGRDDAQAIILIEPETSAGTALRGYLGGRPFRIPEMPMDAFGLAESMPPRDQSISGIIDQLFARLGIGIDARPETDGRIDRVIETIHGAEGKKISVSELARIVSLSEGRLQHIFKGQTGISIKKYLQWKRLIDGVNAIVKGNDFTFASHESGFADSAHMSRTFKEMFGINLMDIFHRSRSVQVIICKN